MRIICTSLSVRMPTTRSRVDCGLSLTMLSFVPTTRLRSVDLPAFGLPTTVTIPARVIEEQDSRRRAQDGSDDALGWRRRGKKNEGRCPMTAALAQVPAAAYSPAPSR